MTRLPASNPAGAGVLQATLSFGVPEAEGSEGVLALFDDATVQLWPSDRTRAEFGAATEGVAKQAVAWGASLVVGLAVAGGLLWTSGRRKSAWGLLCLSGLSGAGAAVVRRGAGRIGVSLTARHSLVAGAAVVSRSRSGGIAYAVREPGLPPWTVTLSPDEFDKAQGEAFLEAVAAALRGAAG